MPTPRTSHDLRCTCPRQTKLAVYGVTQEREPYVHIKVYKQGRVFGEVIATSGVVQLRCRDCGRWTKINVVRRDFHLERDIKALNL